MTRTKVIGAVLLALTFIAACSKGKEADPNPDPTRSSQPSSTPTATKAPKPRTAIAVWVTRTSSGQKVRTVTLGGGAKRSVKTLPDDAQVWAAGSGKLAAYYSNKLHVITLRTGGSKTYSPGSGEIMGGAFSPDGSRLAYMGGTEKGGSLRILNLSTGHFKTIRTFSNNSWDVPSAWSGNTIAGDTVVGFSDAGIVGAFRVNASSGQRTGFTQDTGADGAFFASDARHAADAIHKPLGDEPPGDESGPGPAKPFNTLRTYTVGNEPTEVYSKSHHEIAILALTNDGRTVYYYDDSSEGGFAGISQSPEFGLFSITGTTRHRIESYDGGRWDGGAFASGTTFVAAEHVGSNERLMRVRGNTVSTVDVIKAEGLSFVAVTVL